MEKHVCKSCGKEHEIDFSYCPSCGAKQVEERLTLQTIFYSLLKSVSNIEGPILQTLKDLTVDPFRVSDSYIKGIRKRYISPVKYLFIAITISGISFFLFKEEFDSVYSLLLQGIDSGIVENIQKHNYDAEKLKQIKQVQTDFKAALIDLQKHMNVLNYLLLPLLALLSKWFLNKSVQYNYAEHLAVNAYTFGHASIVQSIFGIIFYGLTGGNFELWIEYSSFMLFLILLWLMYKAFKTSVWKVVLTCLLIYLLFGFSMLFIVLMDFGVKYLMS